MKGYLLFAFVLLLMPIAFLPYPTAVVARHWFEGKDQVIPAMLLYGGTMALIAVMFTLLLSCLLWTFHRAPVTPTAGMASRIADIAAWSRMDPAMS